MRLIAIAALYLALMAGANPAAAEGTAGSAPERATLEALRDGSMKKLNFHADPRPVSDQPFVASDGSEGRLADYHGKWVVLNFWATWCAPCRKEMPMLAALQDRFGGDRFAVVTLATGRNAPPAIDRFFDEIGVTSLPRHRDPKMAIARDMAVLGLPITVILDPEGREIARLQGDADWNSESARAIVAALLDAD